MKPRFCSLCGHPLEDEGRKARCPRCGVSYYDNPLPATAAVVLDHGGRVLLVKRAVDPGKDKWALPGGFIEGEEAPEEGILRELREEAGLEGEVEGLIGVFYEKSTLYGPIIIIGYKVKAIGGHLRPGDDAKDVRFFPPEEIPEVAFRSHRRMLEEVLR